ncbi:uncharacterized protein LOC144038249 [Vanacampus margaritifer]
MPAKKKKIVLTRSKAFTSQMAINCVQLLPDGRQRLNLAFKYFEAVPESIHKLFRVDEVILSRNLIISLPDFMHEFINMQVLDLHSNYLEEIPQTLGLLRNLVVLNLCNNRLKQVPKELGMLQNLQKLYLGLNQLQMLPTGIGNLKELIYLGLSDNKFTSVPRCIANLRNLKKVNLDRNPFPPPPIDERDKIENRKFFKANACDLCKDCLNNCKAEKKKLQEAIEMMEDAAVPVMRVESYLNPD